ncbi:MAG: hypothetical protein MJ147_04035 [Clostridia bacterium]|nr:hypothetical protein [Clostridia bacterium]
MSRIKRFVYKWKNSTVKQKTLWISMLVLGLYILSPIDILSGVEIDDIIAFIGLAGSYFALNDKNAAYANNEYDEERSEEFIDQSVKLAKKYKNKKK